MIPTPLLIFHFVRVFGKARNLVNLISKTIAQGGVVMLGVD